MQCHTYQTHTQTSHILYLYYMIYNHIYREKNYMLYACIYTHTHTHTHTHSMLWHTYQTHTQRSQWTQTYIWQQKRFANKRNKVDFQVAWKCEDIRKQNKNSQKNIKTSDFQIAWKCEDIRKLCYNVCEHVCFMYAFVYVCVYAVFMHTRACLKMVIAPIEEALTAALCRASEVCVCVCVRVCACQRESKGVGVEWVRVSERDGERMLMLKKDLVYQFWCPTSAFLSMNAPFCAYVCIQLEIHPMYTHKHLWHTHTHTHTHKLHICMYVYVCGYACMHVCMRMYVYVSLYVWMYQFIHICVCISLYMYIELSIKIFLCPPWHVFICLSFYLQTIFVSNMYCHYAQTNCVPHCTRTRTHTHTHARTHTIYMNNKTKNIVLREGLTDHALLICVDKCPSYNWSGNHSNPRYRWKEWWQLQKIIASK
jgi:hypothetical protein